MTNEGDPLIDDQQHNDRIGDYTLLDDNEASTSSNNNNNPNTPPSQEALQRKQTPHLYQNTASSSQSSIFMPKRYPYLLPTRNDSPLNNNNNNNDDDDGSNKDPPLPQQRKNILVYLSYYAPIIEWLPAYSTSDLWGDLTAGLSIASFQIPLSISYASALAHVDPIHGLYAFIVSPLMYVIFGSVPQMIVGPEASVSLLVGKAIRNILSDGDGEHAAAESLGIITGLTGAFLMGAGILRLGFLDCVLSRALLRGFISSVGLIIIIEELITTLGLDRYEKPGFETVMSKIIFIFKNITSCHLLTVAISACSLAGIVVIGRIKRVAIQKGYKRAIFIPEILIVVTLSTIASSIWDFESSDVPVLGIIHPGKLRFEQPFNHLLLPKIKQSASSAFLITVLGFFESTLAAKSLGSQFDYYNSSNRELVGLGASNLLGMVFCALPVFGGYGRSKLNAASGAKSQMATVVLSITALLSLLYLLPLFKTLPKCVLAVVLLLVGASLLEEAPADIQFYWRVYAYSELAMLFSIVIVTLFWSLQAGIALGTFISVVRVIQHATRPRIQILGRTPQGKIANVDDDPNEMSAITDCLVIKIPEPLTFANTGDLRNRLRRLEHYGSMKVHPSRPRIRGQSMNQNIILDLNGMTDIDGSAIHILCEIVDNYKSRGGRVVFTRVPKNPHVQELFRRSGIDDKITYPDMPGIYNSISDALAVIDLNQRTHGGVFAQRNFQPTFGVSDTYADSDLSRPYYSQSLCP